MFAPQRPQAAGDLRAEDAQAPAVQCDLRRYPRSAHRETLRSVACDGGRVEVGNHVGRDAREQMPLGFTRLSRCTGIRRRGHCGSLDTE